MAPDIDVAIVDLNLSGRLIVDEIAMLAGAGELGGRGAIRR